MTSKFLPSGYASNQNTEDRRISVRSVCLMPICQLLEEERHRRTEQMKMTALRAAIDEARREYTEGRGKPFDQAAVDSITAAGRRILAGQPDLEY